MGSTLTWPEAAAMPDGVRLALFGPGAPFELTLEDVLGVEMEVFAKRPHSLRDVLLSGAQRFGDRPYVTFPDRELTFSSVVTSACAVAATLRDRYGVTKGDRVGIAAANCVEYAITFWAATMLGAITVAMNGWWTGTELSYGIALTTPKVLLGDRRRLERLAGQEAGVETLVFEDEFAELEAAGAGAGLPDVTFDEDDPFLILFTSGTTGRPKGAVLQLTGREVGFLANVDLSGLAITLK